MATVGGRGEVWSGGIKLASFLVDSGNVTIDRKNASRRSCQATLTSGELVGSTARVVPQVATDLFAPYGHELILYYTLSGVDYQLGVFGITDVGIDDSGSDLVMSVKSDDRARQYARAGFTDVYTIAASANVGTAVQALLNTRAVAFTQAFSFAATAAVMPAAPTVFVPGDDPWAKATELATAIGFELFLDRFGVTTFVPVPDPASAAVAASYDEGNTNTAVHLKRDLSNASTPNWVIRDGQGSGVAVPVRGTAKDTNPLSPTYVGGPYGVVVDFKSSNLYATAAQALAAANAALLLGQGSVETVTIDIIPAPARDVDDVVEVTRVRAGVVSGSKYVVDTVSVGFGPAALMTLTARTVAGIS